MDQNRAALADIMKSMDTAGLAAKGGKGAGGREGGKDDRASM